MILIIEIEQIMLSSDNFYLPGLFLNFIDSIWIQNMIIRNIKNSFFFFGKHLFLIWYQGLQAVVACLCFAFSIETILSQQFNNHRGREYNKFTYTIFLFNTCLNWEKKLISHYPESMDSCAISLYPRVCFIFNVWVWHNKW